MVLVCDVLYDGEKKNVYGIDRHATTLAAAVNLNKLPRELVIQECVKMILPRCEVLSVSVFCMDAVRINTRLSKFGVTGKRLYSGHYLYLEIEGKYYINDDRRDYEDSIRKIRYDLCLLDIRVYCAMRDDRQVDITVDSYNGYYDDEGFDEEDTVAATMQLFRERIDTKQTMLVCI